MKTTLTLIALLAPLASDADTDADGLPDWWMIDNFGHRTGQTGDLSRRLDAPAGDGIPNLTKHALGLNALTYETQRRFVFGIMTITKNAYLSITYTRPEPPPTGLAYSVAMSSAIFSATWTTNGILEAGNIVNGALRTMW